MRRRCYDSKMLGGEKISEKYWQHFQKSLLPLGEMQRNGALKKESSVKW
jgi:hypothetical protein